MAHRAALCFDGFNFYYGVRNHFKTGEAERGYSLSGLCWCGFRALVERHFLEPETELGLIRYLTAPVTESVEARCGEHQRYELWLRAVKTIRGAGIVYGFHRRDARRLCEEKGSDVNLAVELLLDGLGQRYDTAYVLSGDADQIPAVAAAGFRSGPGGRSGSACWSRRHRMPAAGSGIRWNICTSSRRTSNSRRGSRASWTSCH